MRPYDLVKRHILMKLPRCLGTATGTVTARNAFGSRGQDANQHVLLFLLQRQSMPVARNNSRPPEHRRRRSTYNCLQIARSIQCVGRCFSTKVLRFGLIVEVCYALLSTRSSAIDGTEVLCGFSSFKLFKEFQFRDHQFHLSAQELPEVDGQRTQKRYNAAQQRQQLGIKFRESVCQKFQY